MNKCILIATISFVLASLIYGNLQLDVNAINAATVALVVTATYKLIKDWEWEDEN